MELRRVQYVPVGGLQQRHVPDPRSHVQGPVQERPQQAGALRGAQVQPQASRYAHEKRTPEGQSFFRGSSRVSANPRRCSNRDQPAAHLQADHEHGGEQPPVVRDGAGVHYPGDGRTSLRLALQRLPGSTRWLSGLTWFIWNITIIKASGVNNRCVFHLIRAVLLRSGSRQGVRPRHSGGALQSLSLRWSWHLWHQRGSHASSGTAPQSFHCGCLNFKIKCQLIISYSC